MRAFGCLLSAIVLVATGEPSVADCSLGSFDKVSPKALMGSVDINQEKFVFASDVDHVDGQTVVWNYIENKSSSRSLSVLWPKGDISLNISSQLEPGAIACKIYTISGDFGNEVDNEAIIKYGNANYEQRASVYSPKPIGNASPSNVKSLIDLTYIENFLKKSIHIEFSFNTEDGKITSTNLSSTDGYSVGIQGTDKLWTSAMTQSFKDVANEQKVRTDFATWASFGSDATGVRNFLQYANVADGQALFSGGSLKDFGLGEKVSSISQVEIVVFDSSRKPILSSKIAIPNTTGGQ